MKAGVKKSVTKKKRTSTGTDKKKSEKKPAVKKKAGATGTTQKTRPSRTKRKRGNN